MMKLLSSPASPYVRKVRIVAAMKGIADRIEAQPTDTRSPINEALQRENPLSKIPVLILDDGMQVYDSRVICEYLDTLAPEPRLFPSTGRERLRALTLAALADGILDAALLLVYEKRYRPEEKWVQGWMDRQQAKIDAALDHLEKAPPDWEAGPDYAHVTLACALGYLDFRHGGAWRPAHPKLMAWLDRFSAAVPAYAATRPV
ncbi:MAG: glutathione S-transferase N-terminal domain-containing protein [Hyphomicrobiaceae bacterium]|nr:glutathione S-transferase N-terminal domain-containing protein [Hyphomicrobiaceae bacterium]